MGANVPIARRNILADHRRLAISTMGVGLAIALIFLLEGLWGGLLAQISTYPDHLAADLVVRAPDARGLVEGAVPASALDTIRAMESVTRADPVLAHYVILDLHGIKKPATVIGAEPTGAGGPWSLAAGRLVASGADEVVLDETLADDHGITLGGTLDMQGTQFRVVGLSSQTLSFMGVTYVFTSASTARALFGQDEASTFVLVRTNDPGTVGALIERSTGRVVETPEEVAADERELYAGILGKPIALMVGIAFAAGTLIVALSVYAAIVERLSEYGIAKAIGARSGRLFRIVAGQTLVQSMLGILAGAVLYMAASRIIVVYRPQFQSTLTPRIVVEVVLAAFAMGLLAAIVPTRRVTRLDPAAVYGG